ncbi:MAG: hypothetical protein ABIP06_08200 [Pyrinomonadaceae bacterium]
MKNNALKHPYLTGIAVTLLIIMIAPVTGAIIESKYYQPEPDCYDNCGGILITAFLGLGLIFGIITGLTTTNILQKIQKQNIT